MSDFFFNIAVVFATSHSHLKNKCDKVVKASDRLQSVPLHRELKLIVELFTNKIFLTQE